MKICSSCGFKVLDNQKYCPRCGLPINSKPLVNTSEEVIVNDEKQETEKNENQPDLAIIDNANKKHINKPIIVISIITIIILGCLILTSITLNRGKNIDTGIQYEWIYERREALKDIDILNIGVDEKVEEIEDEELNRDEELKNIITYVKTEFARIMKSENIVFIMYDESNNRYLFESAYESSQERYYYYPETNEITIEVPGAEAIINHDFSFKTTFWGEPSDEDYDWLIYVQRRTYYEEIVKVDDSIGNMAKDMFSNMLDYAIAPDMECEIDGIELYLVRVNKGQPWYTVNEFLLGRDGNTYDYWEAVSNNNLVRVEQ